MKLAILSISLTFLALVTSVFGQNASKGEGQKADSQPSIDDYSRAIRLNSKDYEAYNNRGNAKYAFGDLDGAISDFNEAIRLNPHFIHAFNGRGNACFKKGNDDDLDQAITDFDTAIRMDPQYAHAYNGRGLAELAQDGTRAAIDDFTKAISLNPSYAHAYWNRGITEYVTEKYDLACSDLSKATDLDPGNLEAWTYRWLVMARKPDQVSTANQQLSDYLHSHDFDPWSTTLMKFILGELSQSDFLNAEAVKGNECQANFYIGSKAEIAGDKVDATAYYRHCVETDQKSYTDYLISKAKIHLLDHPESAGLGRPPAMWITGLILNKNGVLMYEMDRPVKGNPLGNVVLLGSTLKPMLQIFAASVEKPVPQKIRLYGDLLQSDRKFPGHTEPMPNVEFMAWKLHLAEDPDVLPSSQRILINPDSHEVKAP